MPLTPDPEFAGESLLVSVRHYAEQWVRFDRRACMELRSDRPQATHLEAVTRIAGNYRVARSLRRKHDVGAGLVRFDPLLDAINQVRRDIRASSTAPKLVQQLAALIAQRYKVSAISASSKLLWFVMRRPMVIYDDNALKALGVAPGDYAAFHAEWQRQFAILREDIDIAIGRTSFAGLLAEVKTVAHEEWFAERVFDSACWRAGDRIKERAAKVRATRDARGVGRRTTTLSINGDSKMDKADSVPVWGRNDAIWSRLKTWQMRLQAAGERVSDPIEGDPSYVQVELCGPFAFRLVHRKKPLVRLNINASSLQQTDAFRTAIGEGDMLAYMLAGELKNASYPTPYCNLADFVDADDEDPARVFAAIAYFRKLFCNGK